MKKVKPAKSTFSGKTQLLKGHQKANETKAENILFWKFTETIIHIWSSPKVKQISVKLQKIL